MATPALLLEVLEVMKLFFDMEGFIFVVGLDQSGGERSIDLKYRYESTAANESAYQIRGADYFKKILPSAVVDCSRCNRATGRISERDPFESQLPPVQIHEFQSEVGPHLRYLVAESGVNPREIERSLNASSVVEIK